MSTETKTAVTRTITLSDLTPNEVASIVAGWDSERQGQFFSALWREGTDWPGSAWCGQACYIVADLDLDGMKMLETLGGHVRDRAEREGILLP